MKESSQRLLGVVIVATSFAWCIWATSGTVQLAYAQAELLPDQAKKPQRHKFGVDWQHIDQGAERITWPLGILRLIEAWTEFPDKAAEALRWSQVVSSALSVLTNILIALIVYQLTSACRDRRG